MLHYRPTQTLLVSRWSMMWHFTFMWTMTVGMNSVVEDCSHWASSHLNVYIVTLLLDNTGKAAEVTEQIDCTAAKETSQCQQIQQDEVRTNLVLASITEWNLIILEQEGNTTLGTKVQLSNQSLVVSSLVWKAVVFNAISEAWGLQSWELFIRCQIPKYF